ncbi:GspH/FimT family pseudopilin [Undibacterium sp.]|uniref:GspH/FimT family pseudopilin n=1 Tax=Undibacterium sp. TaxID=1914977 RepID=UPI00375220B4
MIAPAQVQRHNNGKGKLQRGFTLIDLLVSLAILAILLAVAIPSLSDVFLSSKLGSYANNLVASAHLARSEAIKSNVAVIMCASTNGTTCGAGGWESGWIVLNGVNVIQRQQSEMKGYKITESTGLTRLSFQASGVGATQATLTVCRAEPTAGKEERVVDISATGKPSVSKTATGNCA